MAKNITLISIFLFFSCAEKDKSVSPNEIYGCSDSNSINYNSVVTIDDGSCLYSGCTETNAINYDSIANIDDGNCFYNPPSVHNIYLYCLDRNVHIFAS